MVYSISFYDKNHTIPAAFVPENTIDTNQNNIFPKWVYAQIFSFVEGKTGAIPRVCKAWHYIYVQFILIKRIRTTILKVLPALIDTPPHETRYVGISTKNQFELRKCTVENNMGNQLAALAYRSLDEQFKRLNIEQEHPAAVITKEIFIIEHAQHAERAFIYKITFNDETFPDWQKWVITTTLDERNYPVLEKNGK